MKIVFHVCIVWCKHEEEFELLRTWMPLCEPSSPYTTAWGLTGIQLRTVQVDGYYMIIIERFRSSVRSSSFSKRTNLHSKSSYDWMVSAKNAQIHCTVVKLELAWFLISLIKDRDNMIIDQSQHTLHKTPLIF